VYFKNTEAFVFKGVTYTGDLHMHLFIAHNIIYVYTKYLGNIFLYFA